MDRRHIFWTYGITILVGHLLACLAFVPWLFSWSGLVLLLLGHIVFGMLGMTLGYHRLLTHRGFTCPRWLEHTFAILGVCCLQDTPAHWVAVHRMHHQHSDEQPDPHSPRVTGFWSHMGWLFVKNRGHGLEMLDRYARDLLRDRFYFRLERSHSWIGYVLLQWVIYYGAGFAVGWLTGGGPAAGVQLGLSWLVWGVFVRTVLVWHITWAVNSASHIWGYRTYKTGENSRNNWFVALISYGEGWHNNHHAEPRSAAHGHRWWEFDMTYATIRLLRLLGLARNVIEPTGRRRPSVNESKSSEMADTD